MPRYKLTIEYDGTPYVGWQLQENGPSVQGRLRDAVRAFCGEDATPRGAGRTDAGVHALAQVAHLDLGKDWPAGTVRDALNSHLRPYPVAILDCLPVADDFDARFSALRRRYLYRILDRRAPPALDRARVWHLRRPLDEGAMQRAARALLGRHDFTTFRSVHCQAKSPVKTLDALTVVCRDDEIRIEAAARSFMHSQVRSIIGSLKLVGEGKWSADDLRDALEARDRGACGPVAPACGLYLVGVDY